jgi:hypothetical protein
MGPATRIALPVMVSLSFTACAAHYQLPSESAWGYDGEMNGMKMVAAFENQSVCETRRAAGLASPRPQAVRVALGDCEPMTVGTGGTLYWGFGVPKAAGVILFRDEKTCAWFRDGWTEVPTWQKTQCTPFGLQRSKP